MRSMSPYISVFIVIGLGLAAVGLLYVVGRFVAVSRDVVEVLPFQSGWEPREHALSRYHARWYPIALVFLVETPWWTSVVFVMEIIQPVPIVMMSPMVEPN